VPNATSHEEVRVVSETLRRVRALLVDLERHLDRAAEGGDANEVGRAWVRAAQIERALRAVATPEAMAVAEVEEGG
jgi:hypothetical protein